ncbi:MAG TPA: formate/nitrite transporter family protein [bacterium]|nr:formate/nitrite transporter family protein [bacterium]
MNGFLSPTEVALNMVEASKNKVRLQLLPMILLGILAGVYIGFGAELCTMVTHDLSKYLGVGITKFIGGSVFSIGLMLVVIAGAELFTGNCLILTGVLTKSVSVNKMLKNWIIVFIANFAGSILLVIMMYYSGLWKTGDMGVGIAALTTASTKVNLSFMEAFCRGIGCNWLVCLAVWLATAGKDSISKIFGIYFPIMAFVASGFEHSIANMYFIPMGLFLKGNSALVSAAGLTTTIDSLTWSSFLINNLIPVTLGNIIGGAFFVGGIYYIVYLRTNKHAMAKETNLIQK